MNVSKETRNPEAYIELIKQVLFEVEDLPYMNLVRAHSLFALPFRDLLTIVNETHRYGLDANG